MRLQCGSVVARRIAIDERNAGASQQRRTFVDLVERVRAHDAGALAARVDDGLRECEQGLARAIDREHLVRRVELDAVAPLHPVADGASQGGLAGSGRILRQAGQVRTQRVQDQAGRRMARLADPQADRRELWVRRDVSGEFAQPLEGIRVQAREQRIHRRDYPLLVTIDRELLQAPQACTKLHDDLAPAPTWVQNSRSLSFHALRNTPC